MKIKRIIVLIIFMLGIINILYKKELKNYQVIDDGVTYAIILDGKNISSFPERGNYKVSVNCNNGIGKWLPEEWKVSISEIKGEVSCTLNFKSISDNDYLISVGRQTGDSGNGKIVAEKIVDENASYTRTNFKYGLDQNSISNVTDSWTGNGGSTEIFISPIETGYYKICYNIPPGSSSASTNRNNRLTIFRSNNLLNSETIYTTATGNNGCLEYGFLDETDYIKIYHYYRDQNSTIWLEKTSDLNESSFRFEGENPNNWLWFNNEYWRIIGLIPTKTESGNKNLIKIIRDDSIGDVVYDAVSEHRNINWGSNTLYNLLNSYYIGKQDGTETDYCYSYSNLNKTTCDYSKMGISLNDYYGKMVKKVYWNTGIIDSSQPVDLIYKDEILEQTTEGYAGLISISDYGYAALDHNGVILEDYKILTQNNWLNKYNENTINIEKNSMAISIEKGATFFNSPRYIYSAVRPVIFLNENVYVVAGDGSQQNPYIIGL